MINNVVFGKTMKNVRKHRDIKLVTKNQEVISIKMKPLQKKFFKENSLATEMKKDTYIPS